jgi:hypothetical protein
MNETDIVAEVRGHRAEILASFGGSITQHHAAIEARQHQEYAGRLVMLRPRKRVEPSAAPKRRPARQRAIRAPATGGGR